MNYDNIQTFNPKTCISGKVRRLQRLTSNVFRKHLKPFEITESQLTLLFILSKKIKCNQKELTEIAVLEKSTLNRNIQRLIQNKLIIKHKSFHIELTEKGKIFVENIIPTWENAMKEIQSILKEEGIDGINTAINNITKNITQ